MKMIKSFAIFFIVICSLHLSCGHLVADTLSISPDKNKETNGEINHNPNNPSKKIKEFNPAPKSIPSGNSIVGPATNTTNHLSGNQKREKGNDTSQENIERYTFWLAISTGLLFAATVILCVVTWLFRQVAKDEFNATHRPEIIVHTFENRPDDKRRICPIFTYVNSGTSNAIIKSIHSRIFFFDKLRPGAEMKIEKFKKIKTLNAGEKSTFFIESEITTYSAGIEEMKRQNGQSALDLLCIGKITYVDSSGIERETGFCRKFDSTISCWLKVENSDYEYSY